MARFTRITTTTEEIENASVEEIEQSRVEVIDLREQAEEIKTIRIEQAEGAFVLVARAEYDGEIDELRLIMPDAMFDDLAASIVGVPSK